MRLLLLPILFACAAPVMAAGADSALQPGLWEETTAITGATLAGTPTAAPLPAPTSRRMCIAPALAADPGRWFAEGKADDSCTVSRARVSGGAVELAGSCSSRGVADAALTHSRGSYDADSYALDVATTMGDPARAVVVNSRITATRLGECEAKAG